MSIEQGIKPMSVETPPVQIRAIHKTIIEGTPEAEHAPSWFKNTVKTVVDAWFDPKSFEKNPKVYEKLGIKTFKKYLPTGGDLVMRLESKHFGSGVIKDSSVNSLKGYEKFTRVYETIHLTALSVGAGFLAEALLNGQLEYAGFVAGINTLVNVYPIMLQRYNRSRLYRTIRKMEQRDSQPPQKAKQQRL